MDAFRLDLKQAARTLFRRPGFTALAVLTLAIGIGVNTVAFSGVNALLFKPIDVEDRDRTGWILTKAPGNPHGSTTLPDFRDLARAGGAFEAVAAEGRLPVSVRLDGRSDQAWAMVVSANYMQVLGERPELGRLFVDGDLNGPELPALVSYRFWNDRLGGGDSVAGRAIVVNGRSFSVAGVIREGFQGPGGLYEPDLWLPLERIDALNGPAALQGRGTPWLTVVGRLREGVSAAQAEGELRTAFEQLALDHPSTNKERSAAWYPMAGDHPELAAIAPFAWLALAVVGLVLLIACFNVASLLLARTAERRRDIGVRAALGATRRRIVRQLIVEGMILAALSGVAALVLAHWSADLLAAFSLPSPIPQRLHLGVDARLIAFTAALVAIAGVLPALLPALQATRGDLFHSMKLAPAGAGRPSRARTVFVVAQVAGSTLFLATALLFLRSFTNLATFDPGFDTARTVVLELNPATYGYTAERSRTFFGQLRERIAAVPGVQHVALADRVPFYVGYPRAVEISTDGSDCSAAGCREAIEYAVSPRHFAALGIPLRAGRDFDEADERVGNAVIVSEHLAAQYWPGDSAMGKTVRIGKQGQQAEVVGIAADIKHRNMREAAKAILYRPLQESDFAGGATVIVRTIGDPLPLVGPIQDQVQALEPALPARSGKTMAQRMEMPLWPARTLAGFLSICGGLALVLATVGLFGVTYYAVNQRTREFGIRVALGATPRKVMSLVLREGLLLSAPGVAIGVLGSLMAARLMGSALFGVSPGDPVTFAATAAIQMAVALLACAAPAYQATKADPIVALRQE